MSIEHSPTRNARAGIGHNSQAGEEGNSAIEHVRVRVLPDGRLTRRDAAAYLGVAEKTMAMWQLAGKGPKSVLVGGRRFHFISDLDAFIQSEAAP